MKKHLGKKILTSIAALMLFAALALVAGCSCSVSEENAEPTPIAGNDTTPTPVQPADTEPSSATSTPFPTTTSTPTPKPTTEPTKAPATPTPEATPTPAPKTVRITFGGDVTLASDPAKQNVSHNFFSVYNSVKDNSYFFKNLATLFAADDITLVNLEGCISDGGT
nr:CapA family protein [Lachnospiraceae bacterium]